MIEELIRRAAAEDDDAIEELSVIADNDPRRLTPHLDLLLDLDVLWPAKLYRAADAGEGAYYLHLHQPCGFAAVNYQQS